MFSSRDRTRSIHLACEASFSLRRANLLRFLAGVWSAAETSSSGDYLVSIMHVPPDEASIR